MATKPYTIVDRRSSSGWDNNTLHEAATANAERKTHSDLNYDTQKNISDTGRRAIATIAKDLFANSGVKGIFLEQANLSVGTFIPQYYGRSRTWGKLTESWLTDEFLPICDMRAWPYDGDSYLELLVIGLLREGDLGTLLTETSQGYPQIQMIPSHRIRSPLGGGTVKVRLYQDGLWIDGVQIDTRRPFLYENPLEWEAPLIDGCIVGPQGQPIAYRVCDDGLFYANFVDIPARNLFLTFQPEWPDQCRGISALASNAWDWQDVKESRRFELVAQKVAAALYLIETNETGERNQSQKLVQDAIYDTTTGQLTTPAVQEVKGGIRYLRANSGSKIESPAVNRPGQQTQAFQENVLRDALSGLEWSYIFGIDPSRAGGASLRIVVDRINRVLDKRRKAPRKAFKRIIGYAISKAMQLGILPWDDDWWMWEFQGPARMTADQKYDSDVAIQEVRAGFTNNKKVCAWRGDYWEDIDDQNEIEKRRRLKQAQGMAKDMGITWQEAWALLWPPEASAAKPQATSNGQDSQDQNQQDQTDTNAEEPL